MILVNERSASEGEAGAIARQVKDSRKRICNSGC
jgi:hypothetical protein